MLSMGFGQVNLLLALRNFAGWSIDASNSARYHFSAPPKFNQLMFVGAS